jgi:arylsulfatase A-like enzyme/Flp pilus assembly protein TadD
MATISVAGCGGRATDLARPRANILIVTIDTVRADRLGRGFTPTLDQLAARGLNFTHARSVAPLTLPAHTTIFTGQRPPAHGVRLNGVPLASEAVTMAERFKRAGYRTEAVVGAYVLDRRFGLADGFDRYDDDITRDPAALDRLQADRPAVVVADRAIAALARHPADGPWLLWVHMYDPHAPYSPPDDARTRAGGDGYNGEVAYVDQQVARVLAAAAARSDAARLATVIVGDHGESLGDHGERSHGMLVTESAMRVPMIIHGAGVAPAVRSDPVSLLDVLPTVLAIAGLPDDTLPGRVLTRGPDPAAESYLETTYPEVAGWSRDTSLVQDRWKLITGGRTRLFDVMTDPGESRDLSADRASVVQAMARRLESLSNTGRAATPAGVTPEVAARLRALGYVAPSARQLVSSGVYAGDVIQDWIVFEDAQQSLLEGRASAALAPLARLAATHPAAPLFAVTQAQALVAAGRPADALVRLREAVARWPGDASLLHDLAVVARDRGRIDEALRAETAALTLDPTLPSAHHGQGLCLSDLNRHAEAASAFEAAVRLDPTNASYLTDLGNARRAIGDLDAAARAYSAALARAPHLGDAANGLGVVLVQQGRAADAIAWLERAAADATFLEATLNLGIAYQETGQTARARDQYRKVLSARTVGVREKAAARDLLAQLEKR